MDRTVDYKHVNPIGRNDHVPYDERGGKTTMAAVINVTEADQRRH